MGKGKLGKSMRVSDQKLLKEELMFYYSESELCERFMVSSESNIHHMIKDLFGQFMKQHPLRDQNAKYGVAIHPPPRPDDNFRAFKNRNGVNPVVIIKNENSSLSKEIIDLRQEKLTGVISSMESMFAGEEVKEEEQLKMPPLPLNEEGVVNPNRLVNWMDDSHKYLDRVLEHLQKKDQEIEVWKAQQEKKNKELQEKNKELQEKNDEIESWKNELQEKNGEIESWKNELQEKNDKIQLLFSAYNKQVKALASIRIYAAIEYYLKQLGIPILQSHSVGMCCADSNLMGTFDSSLKQAKSLLTLQDLQAMKNGVWDKRRPTAHGLPHLSDFEEAIHLIDLDDSLKNKLIALIQPLYNSSS